MGQFNKNGSVDHICSDRGNYSSTLSQEALAAINAASGGSSGGSDPSESDMYWSCGHPKTMDHKYLGWIAMGKKFELNGSVVNATYSAWTANLDMLVSKGFINECMKVSFLQLNMFNRDHASVADPDGEPETPTPFLWVPYYVI